MARTQTATLLCPVCRGNLASPDHPVRHDSIQNGFRLPEPPGAIYLGNYLDGMYRILWFPKEAVPDPDGFPNRLHDWTQAEDTQESMPQYESLLLAFHGDRTVLAILLDKRVPEAFFDPDHPDYPELGSATPVAAIDFLAGLDPNPILGLRQNQTVSLEYIWVAVAHQGKGLAVRAVKLFSDWARIPTQKLYIDRPLGPGGADFVRRAFTYGYASHLKPD